MVICLERGADLHMAQLMPLPLTVSCFSEIQIGFAFLVPAHPGSPGQRAVKRVCVCVCVSNVRGNEGKCPTFPIHGRQRTGRGPQRRQRRRPGPRSGSEDETVGRRTRSTTGPPTKLSIASVFTHLTATARRVCNRRVCARQRHPANQQYHAISLSPLLSAVHPGRPRSVSTSTLYV